jgi:ADP-heptose:LPS heptosyltransferase
VLHIDERDQPYRNIYGVNWREVVALLKKKGYTVIQIGLANHEEVEGAVFMKTVTNNFLLYLMAGASLFVGIDSGPAAMAVARDVPSVIFFGSVDSKTIHPDLSNICVIEREDVCQTPKCWSSVVGGTTGKPCVVNESAPPCTQFQTDDILYRIDKFLSK